MPHICFVTYELHPTTWGGCGILLHHAAQHLLRRSHSVTFLLDIPKAEFERFQKRDRHTFAHPDRCQGFRVDDLLEDSTSCYDNLGNEFTWKAIRFSLALERLCHQESFDLVEFFEYCGAGYYALVKKLFEAQPVDVPIVLRAHNSIELIDEREGTKALTRERYAMYGLERASLKCAEAVLFPSEAYATEYYLERYQISHSATVISQSPLLPFGSRKVAGEANEVVYYGRINQFKGVERLIVAAFQLLREDSRTHLKFVFIGPDSPDAVGNPSYVQYLWTRIPSELAHSFEFTGHLSHDQLLKRLSHARFAVFPNEFESFCYALHEIYMAGVPVIVNDIPAFRCYFEHDKNALVFDGTTPSLVAAMKRLDDDAALRAQLSYPYPVAETPLGDFYDKPTSLAPLVKKQTSLRVTVVCLVRSSTQTESVECTLRRIRESCLPNDRLLVFREGDDSGGPRFVWLGRLWSIDSDTESIDEQLTTDALWILEAGDSPNPDYLEACRRALGRRKAAFASCWQTGSEGELEGHELDITPEAYPFQYGARPTRALIKTEPQLPLIDLFDVKLGTYGELGYLWQAVSERGPGFSLPKPRLTVAREKTPEEHPEQLALLVSTAPPSFRERLAYFCLTLQSARETKHNAGETNRPFVRTDVETLADEALCGRVLATLALRKLARRARAALPFGKKHLRDGGRPA